MNRKTKILSAIILVTTGLALPVSGAQAAADSIPPEILACATETDVIVRLACYDREVAAMVASPPAPGKPSSVAQLPPEAPKAVPTPIAASAAVPVATASAAPAPKAAPEDKGGFGFDRRMENITAEVVKIRKRPYGELVIYLDNDQVWEQDHVDRRFRLSAGDTVTIKKGTFAGYRLSGESNKSIQVTRRK
jgi:hypothetical protein